MKTIGKMVVFVVLVSFAAQAQLDHFIFVKNFIGKRDWSQQHSSFAALGDQNEDGYDDFLLYDCSTQIASIYFGGNPIDTIPDLDIYLPYGDHFITFAAVDINNDKHLDIFVAQIDTIIINLDNGSVELDREYHSSIYYGGPLLDDVEDVHFFAPEGTSDEFGYKLCITEDFNGDGKSEIWLYDPYSIPDSSISKKKAFCYYVYNTKEEFSTEPDIIIQPNTSRTDNIRSMTSGDINGDGYTDIMWPRTYEGELADSIHIMLGNPQFDLIPNATFQLDESTFSISGPGIIGDLNGDGRDDIVASDVWNMYPYWYRYVLLYGSFPIDTIPDFGFNTLNTYIDRQDHQPNMDVNGDGYYDLVTNTGNHIYIYLGGERIFQEPEWKLYGSTHQINIVANVGDVNGDGVDDLGVGDAHTNIDICGSAVFQIIPGDSTFYNRYVSIEDEPQTTPEAFSLGEPYPNPFNAEVEIPYELVSEGTVLLELIDVTGAVFRTYELGRKGSGKHLYHIKANDLSSGIYFIRALFTGTNNNKTTATKKIILQK